MHVLHFDLVPSVHIGFYVRGFFEKLCCGGKLVGRGWLLQQLKQCERTSSLLPGFVQSTSYCQVVQLGPGEKLTNEESVGDIIYM